jgi:hypothetical protein
MAETKTKAKAKAAKPKARSAAKPKRTRSPGKPKTTNKPQAVKAVEETAKDAGHKVKDAGQKVGHAASKAKVPLMAGGAALAGAAGGLALGARQSHRHRSGIGGVNSNGLAKAAKKVGGFGVQVGELALEGQRARQASNGKAHRSPIEVVLQGLTSRQSRG